MYFSIQQHDTNLIIRIFQCSSTCEAGFQMRRVVCRDEKGDSNLCDPNTQPPDRQSCNMGHCPYWNHGEWSQVCTKLGSFYSLYESEFTWFWELIWKKYFQFR